MTTYKVAEAKAQLSDILRKVETGEEIMITKHGRAIATINPYKGGARELGFARNSIKLSPGWDKPISFEEFFGE